MRKTGLLLVIALAAAVQVRAQSLADLAKKEEERRKTTTPSTTVVTNDDLLSPSEGRLLAAKPADKPRVAAMMFTGYYLRLTRGYASLCKEYWGMDITPFVNAVVEAHREEHAKATPILAAAGTSEEKVWAQNETTIKKAVEHEMNDVPGARGSMEACRGLTVGAQMVTNTVKFSETFPKSHAVLMGTAK